MPPARNLLIGGAGVLVLVTGLSYSVANDENSASRVARGASDFSEQPLIGVSGHGDADMVMTANLSGNLGLACAYVARDLVDVSFVVPRGDGIIFVGPDISADAESLSACPVMREQDNTHRRTE